MEQKSTSDKIRESMGQKPQTQATQGFQNDRTTQTKPKSKTKETTSRKSDNQLAIHTKYEQVVQGLAQQSQHRLAALTSAVVANREQEVEKFVDVLEMADSGELDLRLIVSKLQQRREQRMLSEAPQEFNFNVDGFDTRGYGIDLDRAITTIALTPAWEAPAALPES